MENVCAYAYGSALHIGNLKPGRPPTIRSQSSYRTAFEGDNEADSEDEHPELGRSGRPAQPALPTLKTTNLGPPIEEEQLKPDSDTTTPSTSADSDPEDLTSPSTPYDHDDLDKARWEGTAEKGMSETRKLQVIIEEFGEVTTLMENLDGTPAESERIVAESHGSLYR